MGVVNGCDHIFIDIDTDVDPLNRSMTQTGVSTIPSYEVEERWGNGSHLSGLMSSICIFSETLSSSTAQLLFNYGGWSLSVRPHLIIKSFLGPNQQSLFQPHCDKTSELANKVLVYYHPKVMNI